MRYVFYIILLGIVCGGCERESKIYIPYDGDKIVLNSMIQPDSLIYIRVTRSKPVRASSGSLQFPELSNAVVTISEDGNALPAPRWQVINGRGYYVSVGVAQQGKRYHITAASAEMEGVVASDSTPARPSVRDGRAQASINRIRFILSDPVNEKNYYRLRFFKAEDVGGVLVKNTADTVRCRLDPSLSSNFIDMIGDTYSNDIITSDALVNGKDINFILQTEKDIVSGYIIVEVSNLSEGAYRYMQATVDQRNDRDNDYNPDPVNIYSNVQNGYGIVAGINAATLGILIE